MKKLILGLAATIMLAGWLAGCGSDEVIGDQVVKACRHFVKEKLKSPSTAEFGVGEVGKSSKREDTYQEASYVDSQNGFGATIRTKYTCTVKYNGDSKSDMSNWKLVELQTSP